MQSVWNLQHTSIFPFLFQPRPLYLLNFDLALGICVNVLTILGLVCRHGVQSLLCIVACFFNQKSNAFKVTWHLAPIVRVRSLCIFLERNEPRDALLPTSPTLPSQS